MPSKAVSKVARLSAAGIAHLPVVDPSAVSARVSVAGPARGRRGLAESRRRSGLVLRGRSRRGQGHRATGRQAGRAGRLMSTRPPRPAGRSSSAPTRWDGPDARTGSAGLIHRGLGPVLALLLVDAALDRPIPGILASMSLSSRATVRRSCMSGATEPRVESTGSTSPSIRAGQPGRWSTSWTSAFTSSGCVVSARVSRVGWSRSGRAQESRSSRPARPGPRPGRRRRSCAR